MTSVKKMTASSRGSQDMVRVSVLPNGRLVLPIALRKSLGIERGGQIMAEVVDGEVRLTTPDAELDRARAIFRKHVPAGRSIVDEVIADRRAENEQDTLDTSLGTTKG